MSNQAKSITAEELLKLCWLIANEEAKHLGAKEILPIHFLLAVMKIIDPKFPDQIDKLNISSEDWAAMCKEAQSIRHYVDVMPEKVTGKRRRLRANLAGKQVGPPITQSGMLHRSEELKRAFHDACLFTEGDTLTLLKLVQSLFELELVSIDDIRG